MRIYHRRPDNECIIPFYVLHEKRKLGGVKCRIISNLGSIRVTATIQIYSIVIQAIVTYIKGQLHTIQKYPISSRGEHRRHVLPDDSRDG